MADRLVKIPCPRCDGKGWIPRYWYNRKGICFRCWGEKYIYVKVPEGKTEQEVIAEEKAKEQAHLDAHPPKHPMPENLRNPLYDDPKERAAFKGEKPGKRRGLEDILRETAAQEGKAEKVIKTLSNPIEPKASKNPEIEGLIRPTREQSRELESKDPVKELEELRKQHEELKKRLAELEAARKKQMEEGNISTVRTERGTKVKTRFKVVEADDLITSHDDNGNVNPLFPKELQPRDRSRATSEAQVEHIANNLDPELLADSKKASDGAPIIGSDGVVESGNGRTMAIRRAYAKDNRAAKEYRKFLIENAEEFGLDPDTIKQMKNPVLVRERITDVDRTQFTREANESGVSALSMGEQARIDAEKLNSFVMDQYEGGDFRKNENAPFVQAFFANVVSQADAGRFWTQSKDGGVQLSDEGVLRIRNALFAKAYSDAQLINLLAEARDDSAVKLPLEAMVETAGEYAKLRQGMENGDLFNVDISKELSGAIRTADHLRREGRSVDVYLSQQSLFGEELSPEEKLLLRFLDHNKRRKQNVANFIHNYIAEVEGEGRPDQLSLFGETEPPKKLDLLKRAIAKTDGGEEVVNEFEQKDMPFVQTGQPKPEEPAKPEPTQEENPDQGGLFQAEEQPEQTKQEEQPKPEPQPEQAQTKALTFDDMKAMQQKIREGKATADEIKAFARRMMDNRDSVIQDIYDRISQDPRYKRKHKKTRMDMAERTFRVHLERLAYAGNDVLMTPVFNGKSYEENVLDVINQLTDEKIRAQFEKDQAERAKQEKVLKNPETLSELRQKQAMVGLTAEEEDRLASLLRQEREAQATQEKQAAAQQAARQVATSDRFTIEEDTHTKTGEKLWVAKLKEKVSKEEYQKIADEIRALGGYYSRFKKGFIFKEDPTAKLNGQAVNPDVEQAEQELNAQEARQTGKRAAKLRDQANALQAKIDDIRNADRLTNTARRAAMAAAALQRADVMEQQQRIMHSIADAIESGDADHLKDVSSRTHVETLMNEARRLKYKTDQSKGNFNYEKSRDRDLTPEDINGAKMPVYGANRGWIETLLKDIQGIPGTKRAAARVEKELLRQKRLDPNNYVPDMSAVRDDLETLIRIGKQHEKSRWMASQVAEALMDRKRLEAMGIDNDVLYRAAMREFMKHYNASGKSEEEKRKEALKLRQAEAAMAKIPGYFPTPKETVNRMLEEADIQPGMNVLEPSAGAGHIADAVKDAGANVDVVELNSTLRGILQDKGHNLVGSDFLEFNEKNKYDRIIMNPPFEKGQDIKHVMHAYDLLKPGGKLVAIMSEGAFFRSDKQAKAFQEFMRQVDGYSEQLPEGTFMKSDRQTGVRTRLVVINKPENPAESADVKMLQSKLEEAQQRLERARNTPSLQPFVAQLEKEVERLKKRLAKLKKAS